MQKIKFDRRLSYAKGAARAAYPQMINYFAARYSWGQPCDPRRATDWATLAGYLAQENYKGRPIEWDQAFEWPSGNRGTLKGLVAVYHDGWELLHDLGLVDLEGY